jgi:hypothetical protein
VTEQAAKPDTKPAAPEGKDAPAKRKKSPTPEEHLAHKSRDAFFKYILHAIEDALSEPPKIVAAKLVAAAPRKPEKPAKVKVRPETVALALPEETGSIVAARLVPAAPRKPDAPAKAKGREAAPGLDLPPDPGPDPKPPAKPKAEEKILLLIDIAEDGRRAVVKLYDRTYGPSFAAAADRFRDHWIAEASVDGAAWWTRAEAGDAGKDLAPSVDGPGRPGKIFAGGVWTFPDHATEILPELAPAGEAPWSKVRVEWQWAQGSRAEKKHYGDTVDYFPGAAPQVVSKGEPASGAVAPAAKPAEPAKPEEKGDATIELRVYDSGKTAVAVEVYAANPAAKGYTAGTRLASGARTGMGWSIASGGETVLEGAGDGFLAWPKEPALRAAAAKLIPESTQPAAQAPWRSLQVIWHAQTLGGSLTLKDTIRMDPQA